MHNRVWTTGFALAVVAVIAASGTSVGDPSGVVVTPGNNGYGVGVYATDPGSPSGPPSFTDMTSGGGQPATNGTTEWTEWGNSGPYLCNPQTCNLPAGVPATPRALVDPLTVMQEVVTALQIRRIDIGMVPEPDDPSGARTGLIGMPVWLWDKTLPPESEHTRGPITRALAVGGVAVTATAINVAITWNLGDGGLPVICPAPAVNNMPYVDVFMDLPPVTGCGRFPPGWRKTSIDEPGGQFTVSATSLWVVTWTATTPGGTVGGTFPLLPTAFAQARVGEMQVLGAN